jgi:Protein of unknown function (DUF742)
MTPEPDGFEEPALSHTRAFLKVGQEQASEAAGTPDDSAVSGLRPYLLTSGRAEPVDQNLEIESQVLTTDLGLAAYRRLSFEYREIVRLCQDTVSVAEVAARLGLHIGVARVLVADLAALGYLVVQRPTFPYHQDLNLIERVIRGLEAIR